MKTTTDPNTNPNRSFDLAIEPIFQTRTLELGDLGPCTLTELTPKAQFFLQRDEDNLLERVLELNIASNELYLVASLFVWDESRMRRVLERGHFSLDQLSRLMSEPLVTSKVIILLLEKGALPNEEAVDHAIFGKDAKLLKIYADAGVPMSTVKEISSERWNDILKHGDEDFAEYIADHPDMSNLSENDLRCAKYKARRQLEVATTLLKEKKRRLTEGSN